MTREEYLEKLISEQYSSVKKFAEAVGVPYTTVRSIIERGVGNAKVENVIKMTEGLGITTDDLLKFENDGNQNKKSSSRVELLAAHIDENVTDEQIDQIMSYIEKIKKENNQDN